FHLHKRFFSIFCNPRLQSPMDQQILEDTPVCAVVINHENRHARKAFELDCGVGGRAWESVKSSGEVETASFARLAVNPELAAHEFDQLHRDAQSKAGAAVTPRG